MDRVVTRILEKGKRAFDPATGRDAVDANGKPVYREPDASLLKACIEWMLAGKKKPGVDVDSPLDRAVKEIARRGIRFDGHRVDRGGMGVG